MVVASPARATYPGHNGAQVNAFGGSFSPDGRWIVFRQEDHGRYALERMKPDGSDRHVILPFSPALLPRSSVWGPRADH